MRFPSLVSELFALQSHRILENRKTEK